MPIAAPDADSSFPAQRISSPLGWPDLKLAPETMAGLSPLRTWLQQRRSLLNGGAQIQRPGSGHRSLFIGPPGTGKALAATLLGQEAGAAVYRVDLSRVLSKYLAETEKNLDRVFDRAQSGNWLLLFDEADALFGQRATVDDANDRYANQEVNGLLQRMEDFSGLVILASNLKLGLSADFVRRFDSLVHFAPPRTERAVDQEVRHRPP